MDGGRAGDDAVVVVRVALRHHQALTPARRASVPVRVLRSATVERPRELDADHGHQVFGPVREVDLQRCVRLAGLQHPEAAIVSGVAGVGSDADVAVGNRGGWHGDATRVATTADRLRSPIPLATHGQTGPDVDGVWHADFDKAVRDA